MKDALLYLDHILDCIGAIETYTRGDKHSLTKEPIVADAVVRRLQVLAESAKRLPDEIRQRHPETEWRAIIAFRNLLVHDYLGVDLDRIWEIVSIDLPVLKKQVEQIREEFQ